MGSDELNTSLPQEKKTWSDVFTESFPYYLSIGMPSSEYWDGDADFVKYYREADKLRVKRSDQERWMMGAYIYDTMSRIAPLFRDFAKSGTKIEPYPKYGELFRWDEEDRKREETKKVLDSKARFLAVVAKTKKSVKEGGKDNGESRDPNHSGCGISTEGSAETATGDPATVSADQQHEEHQQWCAECDAISGKKFE